MYSFSKKSRSNLDTCHKDIQILMGMVIEKIDFSVTCGARTTDDQKKLFLDGKSQLDGVIKKSKHQIGSDNPLSMAVDIQPYPVDWENLGEFRKLAGVVWDCWQQLITHRGSYYRLEWGGHWGSFVDMPHWQLVDK